jgi:chromosome segregation protein
VHLKSLTLKGFKSFAQPTTFEFEPGVTAIVGPNGSGKSNVLDGLAWVMGEQGAKSLRGGKMEDVIFAGTSKRGPLGRAEVKLTIDNSDGALPIEYSEVTISRILFRNGSSEYAINGESCRLLDVQELLSDSGLGREMHVIVGQGQLDAVLRATPEERRGFIEEAAGILKHRRRRERTARKLEAMETNLTRLHDLGSELRRQLKPLGRQAAVAKQAQSIAARVRDAKARLLADDVDRVRRELAELDKTESERHSERIVLQEQLEQKQLRIQRLEAEQNTDEVDRARRVTMDLETEQTKLRGLYTQAQQRLVFLASQAFEPEANRLSVEDLNEAKREADRLDTLIPGAHETWQAATQKKQGAQRALDAVDEDIAEQSALVSQHDLKISALTGGVKAAEQKRSAIASEQERLHSALEHAQQRYNETHQLLTEFEQENPETESGDDLERAYEQAQEVLQSAEAERDLQNDSVHQIEREVSALEARVSALDAALDDKDASENFGDQPGLSGRVSDAISVQEGYEAAVGAALGAFSEAILATTPSDAVTALDRARQENLGRLRIVVADTTYDDDSQNGNAHAGLVPVNCVIQAPRGVKQLLVNTFIADSVATAQDAAQQLARNSTHFSVVVADGTVITAATFEGGSGQAPSRIELTADRDKAASEKETLLAKLAQASEQFQQKLSFAKQAKQRSQEAYQTLRQADAERADTAKTRNRLSAQFEAATAELERSEHAHETVAESLGQAERDLAAAKQQLQEAREVPRPILDASHRTSLVEELDACRSAEVEARLEHQAAQDAAKAAKTRYTQLQEQYQREESAAQEAQRREEHRVQQQAQAERVSQALPEILDACDRSVNEARVAQQTAEEERARNTQELTLIRSEESDLRQRLQTVTESVHNAELKSYERKLALSSLLERAGDELGLTEAVLISEYGPEQPVPVDVTNAQGAAAPEQAASASDDAANVDPAEDDSANVDPANIDSTNLGPADRDEQAENDAENAHSHSAEPVETVPYRREEQQKRLKAAEKKLSELGRINPLALEEYAALEQRHAFLNEQLQDLTKTRKDLMTIIAGLDEKMQSIFLDAFSDTQAAFSEVFPILFPGGKGEISLSDANEPLTTGIEMAVRPAGKNVERLSLLSGGERSLAAAAWLIAIFQARPSPFYILDEVEAALDDANLGRLLQVFSELRKNSQLIIITHQKRTMEIADALYGVSMRGDGVSAVVGQKLEHAHH